MKYFSGKTSMIPIWVLVFCTFLLGPVYAAANNGGYLQYQEPQAPAASSWLSTLAYVFTLLLTFALVIGMAYFASRFLGQKMGNITAGSSTTRVLSFVSLGQNKGIYLVEVSGQVLVLGVTEHSINVLKEITDEDQIEMIKAERRQEEVSRQFDKVLQRQLASLQQFSQKFPNVFGTGKQEDQKQDDEKR
jgi:flagellar protein FliO/FliZ